MKPRVQDVKYITALHIGGATIEFLWPSAAPGISLYMLLPY